MEIEHQAHQRLGRVVLQVVRQEPGHARAAVRAALAQALADMRVSSTRRVARAAVRAALAAAVRAELARTVAEVDGQASAASGLRAGFLRRASRAAYPAEALRQLSELSQSIIHEMHCTYSTVDLCAVT